MKAMTAATIIITVMMATRPTAKSDSNREASGGRKTCVAALSATPGVMELVAGFTIDILSLHAEDLVPPHVTMARPGGVTIEIVCATSTVFRPVDGTLERKRIDR
jgi:hypothetical protein